jgi:GNAT superfamily N-acetyltransferase
MVANSGSGVATISAVDTDPLTVLPVRDVELDELVALYEAVGWSAYTKTPDVLRKAITGSSFVVLARRDPRLVGLARAVSDAATICYLQDVLVRPDEQRKGIGRTLVQAILDHYPTVRKKILLTDDEPGQQTFSEGLGFTQTRDHPPGTLRAYVRFDR